MQDQRLLQFRLTTGLENKRSLLVGLRPDNTFTYDLHSGWQETGTPHSLENLQLDDPLPLRGQDYNVTSDLQDDIESVLEGSVATIEDSVVLNNQVPSQSNESSYWDKVDRLARDVTEQVRNDLKNGVYDDQDTAISENLSDTMINAVSLDEVSTVLRNTEHPDAMLDGIFDAPGASNVEKVRRAAERFLRDDVRDQVQSNLEENEQSEQTNSSFSM